MGGRGSIGGGNSISEKSFSALGEMGFNRWQKNAYDRLYINATKAGLKIDTYNTGNISSAYLGNLKVSNAEGLRIIGRKIYIDLKTRQVNIKGNLKKDSLRAISDNVVGMAKKHIKGLKGIEE